MMGADRGAPFGLENLFRVIVSRCLSGTAPTEGIQDRTGLTVEPPGREDPLQARTASRDAGLSALTKPDGYDK